MIKIRLAGLFIIVCILCCFNTAYSAQQGGIQYVIPIEYSLIDENELSSEAESLFQQYLNADDQRQKQVLLEKMLSNYSILGEIDKNNPLYFTRLGIIYDKMHKDRWAKSNFFRSQNLLPYYPYSNYSFANFYFERKEFKKALIQYLKAYNTGYSNHYDTVYQIGVIYEKLGDFSSAVEYFNKALSIQPSEELRLRIQKLELLLQNNSLYNQRARQGT